MKRLVGWNQSGWPMPQPLQALGGLVPYRPDAEELADRRKAATGAKAEREAIRAESLGAGPPARPKPTPAKVEAARHAMEGFEAANREMKDTVREAVRQLIRAAIDPDAAPGILEPVPATPEPVRLVQTTMF
jgi:hypothetical protein